MYERWQKMYAQKRKTPAEVMDLIEDGDRITFPTANGTARVLSHHLAECIKNGEKRGLTLLTGLNLNAPGLCDKEVTDNTKYKAGYISPFERPLAQTADIDPWPVRFFDIPNALANIQDINAVFITVAPMDKHGWFSFALNCSHTYSMLKLRNEQGKPTKIFVEVNKNAPSCYGYNHIHISEVTALIEADWDLITVPPSDPSEQDIAIASYIAEHVPDEATIQLGIGALPNEVGKQLTNRRDLGCHTEMIVDGYLELYKSGALTNKKKTFMPDKMVGSIIFGCKELYEFTDNNPEVEIYGIDFCADPSIIARHDNFIAINAITECDLSGQCISESLGIKPYSGMGGQADFVQGAWQSKGGKAFLALYSSYIDKKGELHSKISSLVSGFVGISRWDVQYLVTEYGCVYLKGASMAERVERIVSIAHPDFREQLVHEAKRLNFINSTSDINIKNMRKTI